MFVYYATVITINSLCFGYLFTVKSPAAVIPAAALVYFAFKIRKYLEESR